ncbi:MAG: RHS repeat domain-containing protein [Bacteroidota bacterium]
MKPIQYIIITVCLLIHSLAYTQPVNQLMHDVVLPAPNPASLGKYLDIPVSHFTGVPNISIPIYTVTEGPLSLPISLSYHSSGIKVAETASWVGLGWNLSAGGMITRTVQGLPDDHLDGFFRNSHLLTEANLDIGDNPILIGESSDGSEKREVWKRFSEGRLDGEADIFSFSVPGYSGKFHFDQGNEIKFVPKQDVDITWELDGSQGFTSFTLTVPDGTRYIFGEHLSKTAKESTKTIDVAEIDVFPTTWYLLRVETPDKKYHIDLEYVNENYSYASPSSCRWIYSSCLSTETPSNVFVGLQCPTENGFDPEHIYRNMLVTGKRLSKITSSYTTVSFNANTVRTDLTTTVQAIAPKRLDQIEIKSDDSCQKYDFTYDLFEDRIHKDKPSGRRLQLVSLQQTSCDNQDKIPPHTFSYNPGVGVVGERIHFPWRMDKAVDHWGYYNGKGANNNYRSNVPEGSTIDSYTYGSSNRESAENYMKTGILEKITYPTGGYAEFHFEANKVDREVRSTPATLLNTPDGYLRNCPNPISCCENVTPDHTATATFNNASQINDSFFRLALAPTNCGANGEDASASFTIRHPDGTEIGSFGFNLGDEQTENAITLPISSLDNFSALTTGTYIVDLNVPTGWGSVEIFHSPLVRTDYPVGGLRIKKTVIHDGISDANNIETTFDYTNPSTGHTSGKLMQEPTYAYKIAGAIEFWGYSSINQQWSIHSEGVNETIVFEDQSAWPLQTLDGLQLGYEYVTVSQEGNGTSSYSFNVRRPDLAVSSIYPSLPYDLNPENGTPASSEVKEASGVNIQKEVFSGGNMYFGESKALMLKASLPTPCTIDGPTSTYILGGKVHQRSYRLYKIKTSSYRLSERVSTLDNVATTTQYEYTSSDKHEFPVVNRVIQSNGRVSEQRLKYPLDYRGGLDFENGSNISIDALVNQHIIGTPIETQTWEGSSIGNLKMIGGQISIFNDFADTGTPILKPSKIFLFETATPVGSVNDDQDPGTHLYGNLDPADVEKDLYKERAYFIYSSSYGNLLEQSLTNGTPISYVWDLSGNRPLAQVVGKTYDQIKGTYYTQFRNTFLDALVTTYTYDGRLRLTSVTGPDNITTRYSYDGLNRLINTKDHDQALLQTIRYHYSGN